MNYTKGLTLIRGELINLDRAIQSLRVTNQNVVDITIIN